MSFTFYGDLLGISSNYNLDANLAYSKLDAFYNIAFSELKNFCQGYPDSKVFMFSDSILFYGENSVAAIKQLQNLYLALLSKNLLLRGAIVKDKLDFEPRFELENFQKRLPINDTLAKAVGLESLYKGARFIIETALAKELLSDVPNWMTQEGFISSPNSAVINSEFLKRITPTPDNRNYEYLYFWSSSHPDCQFDHVKKLKEFYEISRMSDYRISIHYKETIELMKRSDYRKKFMENNG
ncbi:MAG: hypothetical protein Q8N83_13940 [Ignavibacteria bacterium]|nr:hypothetical protein [Ignavibacteria bacterium]